MAVTTAGIVLAAKPADRAAGSTNTRLAPPEMMQSATPQRSTPEIDIPENLLGHRLKIRMAPELGARLLPDGQLLSLKGRDLTELSELIRTLGARLTPAVKATQSDINRIRLKAAANGGGTKSDIAATFWVDGDEDTDLDHVARKLNRLSEVEMVTFARGAKQLDHRSAGPPTRTGPRKGQQVLDIPEMDLVLDPMDTDDLLEYIASIESNIYTQRGPTHADKVIMSIEASQALEEKRKRRPNFYLNGPNGAVAVGKGVNTSNGARPGGGERGPGGACCNIATAECIVLTEVECDNQGAGWEFQGVGTLCTPNPCVTGACCIGAVCVVIDNAACTAQAGQYIGDNTDCTPDPCAGAGQGSCCIFTLNVDVWDRTCLMFGGDDAADQCENLAVDGLVVVVYTDGATNCNEACIGVEGYGACCDEPGVRGGEDTLFSECDDDAEWNGSFQNDVATNTFLAYENCGACVLVSGSCCFGEDVIGTDLEFFIVEDKFARCDIIPAAPISNSAYGYGQRRVDLLPIWEYTEQVDTAAWIFLQNWMGFSIGDLVDVGLASPINLPVISSVRLVGNSDGETACSRCTDLGGFWMGPMDPTDPATFPVTFFGGTLKCGDPTLPYIDSCDPVGFDGDGPDKTMLGSCAVDGELVVVSLFTCKQEAGAQGVGIRTIWQAAMLDPAYIDTDPASPDFGLHAVHQNQWRPNWALYFTPPATTTPDLAPLSPYNEPIITWCPPKNPYILNDPPNVDALCVDPAASGLQVPPNYLVPIWEYAGTYVEWTGWDPERWWNEGVTMQQASAGDFTTLLPPLSNGAGGGSGIDSQLFPAVETAGADWPGSEGGRYDISIRFGLPPTCLELVGEYGLAQRRGDPLNWDAWEVTPITNRWVFEYQLHGNPNNEYENLVASAIQLYPFDYGRNRWTDDVKFFDIGQDTPYPVAHGRGRYLNVDQPGITRWEPQGPQTGQPNSGDDIYGFRYNPGGSGEPIRGSCYFPHSDAFPTILNTTNDVFFPGEQECYVGSYCDEETCCDAVGAIIARCCSDSFEPWDALCVQVAIDIYLADRGTDGLFFSQYSCQGPSPFQIPQYPDVDMFEPKYVTMPMVQNPNLIPDAILGVNQYDPDPRNISLNSYVETVMPTFIDPTYDNNCQVLEITAANSFQPTNRRMQNAAGLPDVKVPPTEDMFFDDYSSTRDFTGRLFQFIPRCQGIYSSAGQCNVPGSKSGRSGWDQVAEDESILIGCQDYDCCLRVIATLLQEKDFLGSNGNAYSDFEWVNFGHLGVPVDFEHPPLSGQWTPYMAMKARELCYPGVAKVNLDLATGGNPDNAPNFSSLQINAVAEAHQLEYDGANTFEWIAGPATDHVTGEITTGLADISSGDSDLRQLIWAPLSWSNPMLDDGSTCMPAHQNMYEMCPEPYYGANGLGIWPEIDFDDPLSPVQEAFTSFASGVKYLSKVQPTADLNAFGRGVKIAVLAESAWLQEYTLFGQQRGAIHPDLDKVILEAGVTLDFTDEQATARGTAVLGVIAASNNGFGVTGLAYEADTYFFPTRGTGTPGIGSQERIEDAFFAALTILDPGDVMVLAFEPLGNTIINDIRIRPFLEIAASFGISIIIPAGDSQSSVGDPPDFAGIENVTVVGAATPGKGSNYLRWWSSNYSDINTVDGFLAGAPNICAWGGGVVTTGGNANLTLLTVEDAATIDLNNGEYTLTPLGKKWSYTNDFGANLDGTLAAAAQVAAATACVQGFSRDWFGQSLLPEVVQARMWSTALTGNVPAGITGNSPANTGGLYTWDLDQVNADAPRSVGRMPQMGRLLQNLYEQGPSENDFGDTERPFSLISLDVITGTLLDGTWFNVTIPGEDEWVSLRSKRTGPGQAEPETTFEMPGGVYYPWQLEITDVMLTFEISEEATIGPNFGVNSIRSGLGIDGLYIVALYDFQRNAWREFQPENLPTVDPAYLATPFPSTPPGLGRYLEPQDSGNYHLYCRILTRATEPEPYIWYLDYVDLQSLFNPRP